MIVPQQADLGRRVVYQPPNAGHSHGIITAFYTSRRVFVRFDRQPFSQAVNVAYLEFAEQLPNGNDTAVKTSPSSG